MVKHGFSFFLARKTCIIMEEIYKGVMMEETKRHKIWNWTKDNADVIVAVGVTVGTVAFAAWLGKKAAKEIAQQEELLISAINAGKTILPNPDGSFWIIDKAS